jgi:hypothetical protein
VSTPVGTSAGTSNGNGHSVAPEPEPVVDAEIIDDPPAPQRSQAGNPALDKLTALFEQLQLDEAEQETVIAWLAGGEWTASAAQIKNVAGPLDDFLKQAGGDIAAAREAMWAAYRKVHGDE